MRARDRERLIKAFVAGRSIFALALGDEFRDALDADVIAAEPKTARWTVARRHDRRERLVESIIRDALRDRRKGREGK